MFQPKYEHNFQQFCSLKAFILCYVAVYEKSLIYKQSLINNIKM